MKILPCNVIDRGGGIQYDIGKDTGGISVLKYPCLVLDHDDTVVCSEAAVNYPAFLEALYVLRPGTELSLRDFSLWTFLEGFVPMCVNHFQFSDEEFSIQYAIWKRYVMSHIPPAFEGMGNILRCFRQQGGIICVSSHSSADNIRRDYMTHFGICPHSIFDWELGELLRKPAPYALDQIIEKYNLCTRDILVVDDLDTGYRMAKARNVDFAWAGWGCQNIPEIRERMVTCSDYALFTVGELEKLLFES